MITTVLKRRNALGRVHRTNKQTSVRNVPYYHEVKGIMFPFLLLEIHAKGTFAY